jgi:hypothetical protein
MQIQLRNPNRNPKMQPNQKQINIQEMDALKKIFNGVYSYFLYFVLLQNQNILIFY